ncbi:MAG: hypothetical protein HZC55_27795 [Verrucomicrobia bacterium]|nr:hypothetical protein [Verrucomicrobiota bacterium]
MSSLPLLASIHRALAGALALVLLGTVVACRKADSSAPAPAAATAPAAAPADAGAPPEVQKMLGRWLRSDGTYELELKGADKSGVVQAAYFNPRSINVSRAIWMRGAEGLQIVVELNDVGYPGATYVLSHDAKDDRLFGKYNQPQMGQTFEVDFVRKKASPLR